MTKKKKNRQKLHLARRSVAKLGAAELHQVQGGTLGAGTLVCDNPPLPNDPPVLSDACDATGNLCKSGFMNHNQGLRRR